MIIPEWIAAEIAAGRTQLQPMLDRAPFPTPAVRTVAESGDFGIIDGYVMRKEPGPEGSWFPDDELRRTWEIRVPVTDELDRSIPAPRALGAMLEVPRRYFRSFNTPFGQLPVSMDDTNVTIAPIGAELRKLNAKPGDTVVITFDPAGTADLRLDRDTR